MARRAAMRFRWVLVGLVFFALAVVVPLDAYAEAVTTAEELEVQGEPDPRLVEPKEGSVEPAEAVVVDEPAPVEPPGEEPSVEEPEEQEPGEARPGGNVKVGDPLKIGFEEEEANPPEPAEPAESEPAESDPPEEEKPVVTLKRKTAGKPDCAYTVTGASMLDREKTALRIAAGYPDVQVMFHMPWDTNLEFAMGGGFFYALNAQMAGELYGGSLIGEGRWRFHENGEHSLALVVKPSLMAGGGARKPASFSGPREQWIFGLVVGGPGLLYDYEIKRKHHAVLGFSIPFGFYWSEYGFATRIPFVAELGGEVALSRNVHIFITTEVGLDLWTGNPPRKSIKSTASFFARGLIGLSFLL